MEPEPPEVAGEDTGCTFGRCLCCWLRSCSSRIPPVAPGRDYERIPLGDDGRSAWSLLLGFLPPSSAGKSLLHLCRFRVASSGRVLGRSDDPLEILPNVDYDAKGKSAQIRASAAATSSTDSCLLGMCLFCLDFGVPSGRVEPPRPMELNLDICRDKAAFLNSLPHLPPRPFKPICPIVAAGNIWAPGFLNHCGPSSLVMLRLDKESKQWVQVATMEVTDCFINGYAVVHDTILLSLNPQRLFVVFNCITCAWTAVKTSNNRFNYAWTLGRLVTDYIPICGRGLYVEEDDTIYFLSDCFIYAYKPCQDQDQCQYRMALPTIVDRVCPFSGKGSGFLTYLGDRVMCFVWISVPCPNSELRCNCDAFHVLITTFRVIGDSGSKGQHFVPKGVQVLHSTCRRLDIDPSKSSVSEFKFCFLQEHEECVLPLAKKMRENEMTPSMSLDLMEIAANSNVVESLKMLTCCRDFFSKTHLRCALRLENSVIQTTKDLFIVCQTPSYALVFKINITDGRFQCHNQNLTPYSTMDTFVCADPDDLMEQPFPWHFICCSTSIHAVQDKTSDIHVLSLAEGTASSFEATRPVGIDFSIDLVLTVGPNIIAISDTLGVYQLSDTHEWERHSIQGFVHLERMVKLSGYVVLNEKSFMVCDAKTSCCFLFDLDKDTWSIVEAYSGSGFLSGRSVFAAGFIYTCADGGLRAYEMVKVQNSYSLGEKISLDFPWMRYWERNRMCLDYIGQDISSGAVMFCVVQGNEYEFRPDAPHKHPVLITTIQIKAERTSRDTLKPVAVGHVNIGTSFVRQDGGPIWTSSCFALDSDRCSELAM